MVTNKSVEIVKKTSGPLWTVDTSKETKNNLKSLNFIASESQEGIAVWMIIVLSDISVLMNFWPRLTTEVATDD